MIGSGLKKLAQENGMKVAKGVAYGSLQGFNATMSEGAGWKQIAFSTALRDPEKKNALMEAVNRVDVQRLYRVQNLGMGQNVIQVVFLDNPGTMNKIREFLAWFLPLLRQYGATPANVCPECGGEVTSGRWLMVNGIAHYLHDSCAQKTVQDIGEDNLRRGEEDNGSYIRGALGAIGGAVIGAVLWAVVLNLGYVASLVGLVIGWLAQKGYDLLKGKQGKGKVVILIFAVILGVLLGTLGAYGYQLAVDIHATGAQTGFTYGDIPMLLVVLLVEEESIREGVLGNSLMGLAFAALGVFAMLRQTGKSVSGTKVTYLE